MIKLINKFLTFSEIKRFLISYLLFGIPVGIIITESINIIKFGWKKYTFNIEHIIIMIIIDLIIVIPFIIIYFRCKKKLNKLIKKIFNNSLKEKTVKFIFNYKTFNKGEIYKYDYLGSYNLYVSYSFYNNFTNAAEHINYLFIFDKNDKTYNLVNIINKIELDNLKESRLKKLKKLKKMV